MMTVRVTPCARLNKLELVDRGRVRQQGARVLLAHLPRHVATRELEVIGAELDWPPAAGEICAITDSRGPGNAVVLTIAGEHACAVFTAFGQRGLPAETVALDAAGQARRYLQAGVPVGAHLADQLLIPMAMAGGTCFRTLTPSAHVKANIRVIEAFLDVRFELVEVADDVWEIRVGDRPAGGG